MIGRIIMFPFWVVQKILGSGFAIVKIFFGVLFGILRFLFSRTAGVAIGLVAGLFLGNRHVKVKLFPGDKK